jgi:hypothetical protein
MLGDNIFNTPPKHQDSEFPIYSDKLMFAFLRMPNQLTPVADIVTTVNYIKSMLDEFLKFDLTERINYDTKYLTSCIKYIAKDLQLYLRVAYNIPSESIYCLPPQK